MTARAAMIAKKEGVVASAPGGGRPSIAGASPLGWTRADVLRSALGLGASALAAAVAACGPARAPSAPQPASGVPKQPVRIQMFNQSGDQQHVSDWTAMLQPFTQKHPNVTFDIGGAPAGPLDLLEKATALSAAGTPPDITYSVTRNGPSLFTRGLTQDMNPVVRREKIDLKDVAKPVLENFDWKGALLALPYDPGYAFIHYNRGLFEKAGTPDPGRLWQDKKWDWNAFVQTAAALSRTATGEPERWGFQVKLWEGCYLSFVRTLGGNVLSQDRSRFLLDDGPGVAAVTAWAELVTKQKVSPVPGQGPRGDIQSGAVAMVSNHPGAIRPFQKFVRASGAEWSWDVVPHPAPPGKKPVPVLFTNGLYLWKGTKQEATAIEVLKHLMSNESMLLWGSLTGRDPARTTLLDDHLKNLGIPADDPKSWPKVYRELTPLVQGVPWTVDYIEWHNLVYEELLKPVLRGEKSAQDAARSAAPTINAVLQRRY